MPGAGGEAHDDRRPGRDAGSLEDGREPAPDGRARRMLSRDAQPAGRPGVTECRRRRKQQVVHDGLEGARREDRVEGCLGLDGRRRLGGGNEAGDELGSMRGRRISSRPGGACQPTRRMPDGHLAGRDRPGRLGGRPTGLDQTPHRQEDVDGRVVVEPVPRRRPARSDDAIPSLPRPYEGGAHTGSCRSFLDRVHGMSNDSTQARGKPGQALDPGPQRRHRHRRSTEAHTRQVTITLPPPVAGIPFDVATAAGRVAGYELGHGRTVLLLHSFNAAGAGVELASLGSRLAEHRRVVLVDWLGFGTSDRPEAPYGWALYADQLERIREATLQPDETSVDVVALSLPGQYVVVAAAEQPERFGRIVLISPTGFGRFKGDAGRGSRTVDRFLRLTGIGRLLFAVLARRRVIRWFLRQTFADPEQIPREYERYCWQTCQQPGASRAPLAFVAGLLNDPRAESAYQRLTNPTLLVFGDHPRFTDPAAAEALVASNSKLQSVTIERAGDLPQLEQLDATAAVVEQFLGEAAD